MEEIRPFHRAITNYAFTKKRLEFIVSAVFVGVGVNILAYVLGWFHPVTALLISSFVFVAGFLICWAYTGAAREFAADQIIIRYLRNDWEAHEASINMRHENMIRLIKNTHQTQIAMQRDEGRRAMGRWQNQIAQLQEENRRLREKLNPPT